MRKYAIVALVALFALGCEFKANVQTGPKPEPKPTLWVTLSAGGRLPGPHTYMVREPLVLPDGSRVVCVATLKDLWCRDAK